MRLKDESPTAGTLAPPPRYDVVRHALFLDIDGTLAEIAPAPELAVIDSGVRELLTQMRVESAGAVAALTGRALADAERLLDGAVGAIGGLHGAELRLTRAEMLRAPADTAGARAIVSTLRARDTFRARIEDKGASVALHYRHAPHLEEPVRRAAEALAQAHGMIVLHGKMVVEIVPAGVSKGGALTELMGYPPFRGRIPAAVGDDVTDESAFIAARALGGFGVLVGAPRETAAAYILENVSGVHAWLRHGVRAARA